MRNNGMDKVKVGQTVKVIWIDSGCHYTRAGVEPSECELSTCVNYGKLLHRNRRRIVMASQHHHNDGTSPYNDQYDVIWRQAIKKIRRLR